MHDHSEQWLVICGGSLLSLLLLAPSPVGHKTGCKPKAIFLSNILYTPFAFLLIGHVVPLDSVNQIPNIWDDLIRKEGMQHDWVREHKRMKRAWIPHERTKRMISVSVILLLSIFHYCSASQSASLFYCFLWFRCNSAI